LNYSSVFISIVLHCTSLKKDIWLPYHPPACQWTFVLPTAPQVACGC